MDSTGGTDDVVAEVDAVVLAGGSARRLGGVDKPALEVGGRALLDHVLDAVAGATRVVCVGPARPTDRPAVWCREDPPGSGPVAALAAGVARTSAPRVAVLAADLPSIAPAVPLLLAGLRSGADAAVLVDAGGRVNHLAAVWRRDALVRALAAIGDPAGAAMRALTAGVRTVQVPDTGGWGRDCDTWDDVRSAREGRSLREETR